MATDMYLPLLDGVPMDLSTGLTECSGRVKLACQWFKALMTALGSDPHDTSYGSVLAELIGGNVASITDAADVLALAVSQVNAWMRASQSRRAVPLNERLARAEVVAVSGSMGASTLSAVIAITSEAGEMAQLRLNV